MDNQSSCALGALGANAEHPPSSCLVLGMKKVGIYTSSLQTVVEAAAGVAGRGVDSPPHAAVWRAGVPLPEKALGQRCGSSGRPSRDAEHRVIRTHGRRMVWMRELAV